MVRGLVERRASIERVAEQRVTYRSQVDADLMSPGVVGTELEQGAHGGRDAAEDLGPGGLGAEALDLARVGASANLATIARVVRNRRLDDYGCVDDALASREVSLLDLSRTKLLAERIEGFSIASRQHQS
jgi:hypothetical protein